MQRQPNTYPSSRRDPRPGGPGHALAASSTGRAYCILVALILAVATAAAHGQALWDGLFFDDHWHQAQLASRGWGWSDLLESATLEPSRFLEMWWQTQPIRWQYARPVSILLMKVVHALSGGSVVAHHAVSLLLHYANACMVAGLIWRLTRHRYWTVVGGLLFVIYSHSVFAVGWLAAQNAVLQTTFTLAALHVYLRATRLCIGPKASLSDLDFHPRGDRPNIPARSACEGVSPAAVNSNSSSLALRAGSLAVIVGLYLLALFSRENAVMLPVILLAFDWAFGRSPRTSVASILFRPIYIILGGVTIAFLIWRLGFYYAPMPDIYSRHYDGPGYFLWLIAKLLHYLCSAVWLSPMVVGPSGRINPYSEVPGDAILTIVILIILGLGYWSATRRVRGWWIWPLWLLLAYLPVTPILPTPHQGYLGGVGFAVAMVLGPAMRRHVKPGGLPISAAVATWFLIATTTYIPIYRTLWNGMRAAERMTTAQIEALPPPTGATDLYFINLPFVNIYTELSLREAWGDAAKGLRCHALTFAPEVMLMDEPCVLSRPNDHTLRVRLAISFMVPPQGGYFSGLLGRFLLQSMRPGPAICEGDRIAGEGYTAIVREANPDGITTLDFEFPKPLNSPEYRFYLTSRSCPLAELRMSANVGPNNSMNWETSAYPEGKSAKPPLAKASPSLQDVQLALNRVEAGHADAVEPLFDVLAGPDGLVRTEVMTRFGPIVGVLCDALGAPLDGVYLASGVDPLDAWRARVWPEVADWWRVSVDDRAIREVWIAGKRLQEIEHQRNGINRVRSIAGGIIRTDLYMTGPPFPGPKFGTKARQSVLDGPNR